MANVTGITYVYPHEVLPRFFADAPLTQDACNDLILSTCRKQYLNDDSESTLSLDPVDGNFQGAFSYTVKVSIGYRTLVAQFRKPKHTVDRQLIETVHEIYGDLVPRITFHDDLPMQLTFSPYAGVAFAIQEQSYGLHERRVAVCDYAQFIARGLVHSRPCQDELTGQIQQRLLEIASWDWGNSLRRRIEAIAEASYVLNDLPLVLTHGDPNLLNVLSDADGHITGIIDWGESIWFPFGLGSRGLEGLLGGMTRGKYFFHEGHESLRELYFQELVARLPEDIRSKQSFMRILKATQQMGVLMLVLKRCQSADDVLPYHLTYLEAQLMDEYY